MRTPDAPEGLPRPLLALLCSTRCPGNLVLLFYELARRLRDEGIGTMGGFQTPMEQEALDFLIRGKQPVIWVPSWTRSAKGLAKPQREALEERGLRLISIFDPPKTRPSQASGQARNNWIVEHADAVLVVHAHADGLTEKAAKKALETGKPTWTLRDAANNHLRSIEQVTIDHVLEKMKKAQTERQLHLSSEA
jgi:hypothetical protein